jgi:large subunit ribosomal protein L6
MSRVAKKIIAIPSGVDFSCRDGLISVSASGKTLTQPLHETVELAQTEQGLSFLPKQEGARANWAMAGTMRALVANMLKGVTEGFKIELQLVGVGYRAKLDGRKVVFTLGKSHPDVYQLPDLVDVKIEKDVNMTLESINKQLLGQVAAEMVALRKPDAYKGKGVRRVGVVLKLKEVKKK